MTTNNIRIVGVGGQGIILASNLIGDVALAAGLDIKKAEVHGMSQRGGSVTCDVRFGERVYSPLIPRGEVQIIAAFERLEAVRALPDLAPEGVMVVNRQSISPSTVLSGQAQYPLDTEQTIERSVSRVIFVDGPEIASQLGDHRVINSAVLGALSLLLPFELSQWEDAYQKRLKNKGVEVNLRAFDMGLKQAQQADVVKTKG